RSAARGRKPGKLLDRYRAWRLPRRRQQLRQLAARARRRVRLAGAGVVDDLDVAYIAGGFERELLQERRRDREISGGDDADPALRRLRLDLGIVGGAETRRADHDMAARGDGGEGVALHRVRLRVVDDDIGRGAPRLVETAGDSDAVPSNAGCLAGLPGRGGTADRADERQIVGLGERRHEGAADPTGRAGKNDARHCASSRERFVAAATALLISAGMPSGAVRILSAASVVPP